MGHSFSVFPFADMYYEIYAMFPMNVSFLLWITHPWVHYPKENVPGSQLFLRPKLSDPEVYIDIPIGVS